MVDEIETEVEAFLAQDLLISLGALDIALDWAKGAKEPQATGEMISRISAEIAELRKRATILNQVLRTQTPNVAPSFQEPEKTDDPDHIAPESNTAPRWLQEDEPAKIANIEAVTFGRSGNLGVAEANTIPPNEAAALSKTGEPTKSDAKLGESIDALLTSVRRARGIQSGTPTPSSGA